MLLTEDHGRVRVLTLDRPDALNAFNTELYDTATDALLAAGDDSQIAVVVLTGTGRAFSAGADLIEMATLAGSSERPQWKHGFPGFVDTLIDFPKPLVCAVNGLALGIGATLLAYADLVVMGESARIRCPFTSLAVAPEAASSFSFPWMLGRQAASWVLLSSEWLSAAECERIGLAWKVCPDADLLATTLADASILAAKPISSLIETKATIVAPLREHYFAARTREDAAFARLMGQPANIEALTAFAEKRPADFAGIGQ